MGGARLHHANDLVGAPREGDRERPRTVAGQPVALVGAQGDRVGDHVRVVDGPFSAFTGVVDEVNNERGKVKVMVSIFGRATPVELDFLQVQPV